MLTERGETKLKNQYFGALTFTDNETGVYLRSLPGEGQLYFDECVFEGNGKDLVNETVYEILYELPGN